MPVLSDQFMKAARFFEPSPAGKDGNRRDTHPKAEATFITLTPAPAFVVAFTENFPAPTTPPTLFYRFGKGTDWPPPAD